MPVYSATSTPYQTPYYSGYQDAVFGSVMQERNVDIISNNLANVNTAGFKADRMIFSDYLQRKTKTFFEQGSLRITENPLDLALTGKGFFKVQTPQGNRLTRNGAFHMTGEGNLVNSDGYPVLDNGGAPVVLNAQGPQPTIDSQGNISQGTEQVAQLGIFEVEDMTSLVKEGNNLYAGAGGKEPASADATETEVQQGALEASNVKVAKEMVNMISAYRAFESYQKAIRSMNEIDLKAASQLGAVG